MPDLKPHVSKQVPSIQHKTKTCYQGRASLCDGGDKIKTEGSCWGDHWRLLCVSVCTFRLSSTYIGMVFNTHTHTHTHKLSVIACMHMMISILLYVGLEVWKSIPCPFRHTPTLNLFTYSHVRVPVCVGTRLSALASVHMYARLTLPCARFQMRCVRIPTTEHLLPKYVRVLALHVYMHNTHYQHIVVYTSFICTQLYLWGSRNCNSMHGRVMLNSIC